MSNAISLPDEATRLGSSQGLMRGLKQYTSHGLGSHWKKRNKLKDPPAIQHLELFSVFPTRSEPNEEVSLQSVQLSWYGWWIHQQINLVPDTIFSVLRGYELDSEDQLQPEFVRFWEETATYMKASQRPCIDTLILHLVNADILESVDLGAGHFPARNLVFAVLGWQTMLYRAEIGTCPSGQLAIADEMDGYQGQGQVVLKQDQASCKRPLHQFLMGFGVLLPPSNFLTGDPSDWKTPSESPKTVQSNSLNVSVLESIGGLTIRWIDSLAHHLELDQPAKILYLYRFPSFCIANIPSRPAEKQIGGVIHAFGASEMDSKVCASTDEISSMLQETLLSYRLLFGQSKPGRELFRKLRPFDKIPEQGRDNLLTELCGRKRCNVEFCKDQESYDLSRDFPVYKSRLIALSCYMSQQRPRSWKELWRDKRDSAQWFTFWAVLVFGGFGLLIGLLQVILQIVQIGLQVH